MAKTILPSEGIITADQLRDFFRLQTARFRDSKLPSELTLHVLARIGPKLVDVNVARIRRQVEALQRHPKPKILRRKPFRFTRYLGSEYYCERIASRSVATLDPRQIILKDYLQDREGSICGDERQSRIENNPSDVQLDGKDFVALYEEPGQLALRWLHTTRGVTQLSFWGAIPHSHRGDFRFVLCLYRLRSGAWDYRLRWIDSRKYWGRSCPAGVLKRRPPQRK